KANKSELLTLPRHTKPQIPPPPTQQNINHPYPCRPPNMPVKTIQKLINLPIHHYPTIHIHPLHHIIHTLPPLH
ncbi:LCP family glycopolymer transferase, partial [Staphylococcus epidermidis]|uniref:LCP family glycopolymer transferase n=1 Tax=Staphylococcus epidermidis TaxID=1282 RepID=UPI001642FD4D